MAESSAVLGHRAVILPSGFGPGRNPDGAVVPTNNDGRYSLAGQSIKGSQTEASGAVPLGFLLAGAIHPVRRGGGRGNLPPRFVKHKFVQ